MADYDIEKAFQAVENELMESMIRNMKRHRLDEISEGKEWEMWQALQLKSLEEYRVKNRERFNGRFAEVSSKIEGLIKAARQEGGMDQEKAILQAIKKGFKVRGRNSSGRSGDITAEFFKVNDRKLDALIRATQNDFKKAEHAMLRMAEDQYRKVIFNAQIYANAGAGTYEKAVDMATRDFISRGINCIEYANGARHTIADYAEMAIKTASKRAYLTGEGEKRQEWGISLVIMKKRGNACPKCLPFVGKVLIDDVWSGGKQSDGPYMLMSTAISRGLYHPRCKDIHTTYFEGITKPGASYTKAELAEVEEAYRKEQKEQYAKRQEEKFGRLAKYSLDEENQEKYHKKEKEWKSIELSLESDRILSTDDVVEKAKQLGEGVVTGKERLNLDNGNVIFDYVTRKLGYDGKPTIVSNEVFEKMVIDSPTPIMYRGINADTREDAIKYAEEFKFGKMYAGKNYAYGSGTYFSPSESIANRYNPFNVKITAVLSGDSKIADYAKIVRAYSETGADVARVKKGDNTEAWEDVLFSVGEFASIKGYDAISMNGAMGQEHIIVLNRGKVVIKDEP